MTSLETFVHQDFSFSLFVPNQQAIQQQYLQQKIIDANTPFPYWVKVWPSAIGLSYFINNHRHYIQNKKVLELAAGLGLPSLVAAKWAATICCSDYLQAPLNLVKASADFHQIQNINYQIIDWFAMPKNVDAEVILMSDINYEPAVFDVLFTIITNLLVKQTTIILSTPQRLLAKPFIERLLPFCTFKQSLEVMEDNKVVWVQIMVLQAKTQ